MYRTDVWDLEMQRGTPVESVDWTAATAPGDLPDTGTAAGDLVETRAPSGMLAAGIGLLFILSMAHAADPGRG